MALRSCPNFKRDEAAPSTARPFLSQRNRRLGKSDHREYGGVVLEKARAALSRSLRNRGARDADGALRVSRRITIFCSRRPVGDADRATDAPKRPRAAATG